MKEYKWKIYETETILSVKSRYFSIYVLYKNAVFSNTAKKKFRYFLKYVVRNYQPLRVKMAQFYGKLAVKTATLFCMTVLPPIYHRASFLRSNDRSLRGRCEQCLCNDRRIYETQTRELKQQSTSMGHFLTWVSFHRGKLPPLHIANNIHKNKQQYLQ